MHLMHNDSTSCMEHALDGGRKILIQQLGKIQPIQHVALRQTDRLQMLLQKILIVILFFPHDFHLQPDVQKEEMATPLLQKD